MLKKIKANTIDWVSAYIFFQFGLSNYRSRNFPGSLLNNSKAIRLKPDFTFAYFNRGLAKFDISDFQGAIEDYLKAVELKPNFEEAINALKSL